MATATVPVAPAPAQPASPGCPWLNRRFNDKVIDSNLVLSVGGKKRSKPGRFVNASLYACEWDGGRTWIAKFTDEVVLTSCPGGALSDGEVLASCPKHREEWA